MTLEFNASFNKNMGHTIMTLEPILATSENTSITYTENFRIKMVLHNSIKGLLKTHTQYINNIPSFCYDISGLQSLSVILENKQLNYDFLTHLIYSIYDTLLSCENYMLDIDMLLLSPDYIFLSPDYSNIGLCYYPLNNIDFTLSLRYLFDYILKQIDHKDEKSIYLAYSIHNQCTLNNITPNILLSYITQPSNDNNNNSIHPKITTYNTDTSTELFDKKNFNFSQQKYHPSIPESNNFVTDNSSDSSNSSPNKSTPEYIIKLGIAAIILILCLTTISCLLLFKIIDFPIFIILLFSIISIFTLTGYNIYKNDEGPITDILIQNKKHKDIPTFFLEDSCNTILLSSPDNVDSHMLIYSGSDGDSQINITHYPFTIGKNNECDLILNNPIISRLHSRIHCNFDTNHMTTYYIEDLNSSNGTYLNGEPLNPYKKYALNSGDNITFGHLTYIFR